MTDNFSFDQTENDSLSNSAFEGPAVEDKIELPHTVALKHPVAWTASKTVTEVTLKNRLTASAVEHLPVDSEKLKYGHYFPIIAHMAGESRELIRKLDKQDMDRLFMIVSRFLMNPGG